MSLVLDASATLARIFPDEKTAEIESVFANVLTGGAYVTEIWRIEVANTLLFAFRKKRVTTRHMLENLQSLDALPIVCDTETNSRAWADTLILAGRHSLTVYDATYLELALRLSLPLATLDKELRLAAQAEGVALLGL